MERKDFVNQIGASALLASLGLSLDSCTYDKEQVNPPLPLEENPPEEEPFEEEPSGEEPPSEEAPKVLTTFSLTNFDFRALTQDDGWLLHPSEDILLLNVAGTITALDSECPHNGCTHDWDYADSEFICTCHFSKFDREGKVLLGPAEADLTQLNVIKDGNKITVTE